MRGDHQGAAAFLPRYCFGDSFCITSSRLKLAGFCRIGNSLKLDNHCATTACDGTMRNARSAIHLPYSNDSVPLSKGSVRRLYMLGARRLVNFRFHTLSPVCSCSLNATFQEPERMASRSPSSL